MCTCLHEVILTRVSQTFSDLQAIRLNTMNTELLRGTSLELNI